MPRSFFIHEHPDRYVVGTVGEPGARTFYLQARTGTRTTSVAIEKQQVAVLAERLDDLLDELMRQDNPEIPAMAPAALEDLDPLETPVEEEFRAASLALGWDEDEKFILIEAQAPTEVEQDGPFDDEDPEGPDLLRVTLSPSAARAFVKRAMAVVGAGRPACPFCSLPLDPAGHVCPRANGYRR